MIIFSLVGPSLLKFPNHEDIKNVSWFYGTGKNGVNQWPGVCADGNKQSPIDILPDKTIDKNVCPFIFKGYDTPQSTLEVVNKWHSVYFYKDLGSDSPLLTGGDLPGD